MHRWSAFRGRILLHRCCDPLAVCCRLHIHSLLVKRVRYRGSSCGPVGSWVWRYASMFLSRAKLEHDQPADQPLPKCGSSSCRDRDRGPAGSGPLLGLVCALLLLQPLLLSVFSSKPPVVHRERWYSGAVSDTWVGTFHGAGKHGGHDRAGLFHSGSPESRSSLRLPSIPTVGSFPDIAIVSIP